MMMSGRKISKHINILPLSFLFQTNAEPPGFLPRRFCLFTFLACLHRSHFLLKSFAFYPSLSPLALLLCTRQEEANILSLNILPLSFLSQTNAKPPGFLPRRFCPFVLLACLHRSHFLLKSFVFCPSLFPVALVSCACQKEANTLSSTPPFLFSLSQKHDSARAINPGGVVFSHLIASSLPCGPDAWPAAPPWTAVEPAQWPPPR